MNYEICHFPQIESTNSKALELLEQGCNEGIVIVADRQTAGKGRQGRRWVSNDGNLFLTIALRPNKPLQILSELAFVAAIAVGRALKGLIKSSEVELHYKWPNDVLLNTQKVCGILIESYSTGAQEVPEGCVVGIGVNINSYPEFTIFPANHVNNFAKTPVTKEMLLPLVLDNFKDVYQLWQEGGFGTLKNELLQHIYGLGRVIHATTAKGLVYGVFEGICDDGAIQLKDSKNDIIFIRSSEVTFE